MINSLQLDITPRNHFQIRYYQKKDGEWKDVPLREYSKSVADMIYQEVLSKIQRDQIDQIKYRRKEDGNYALHLGFGSTEVVLHHYDKFLERSDFSSAKEKIEEARIEKWKYVSRSRALKLKREKRFQQVVTSSAILLSTVILLNVLHFAGRVEPDKGISREDIMAMMSFPSYQQMVEEEKKIGENTPISIPHFAPSLEENTSSSNDIITFVSNMYHMTPEQIANAITRHPEEVEKYDNLDIGIMRAAAMDYWDTSVEGINREVEKSSLTSEEKEQVILQMVDMYGIKDTETRATLLAIYRLETEHGNSNLCVNYNNFGGVRGLDGSFLEYPTIEAGADSLVRSVMNLIDRVKEAGVYQENQTIAQNIGLFYCERPKQTEETVSEEEASEETVEEIPEELQEELEDQPLWEDVVDQIKDKIITEGVPNLVVSSGRENNTGRIM